MCGIRDPTAALCAASVGADFIGMIFAKSKRQVNVDEAKAIVTGTYNTLNFRRSCFAYHLSWFDGQLSAIRCFY